MPLVVGVRFHGAGKIYDYDPGELELLEGDAVIVPSNESENFAIVARSPHVPVGPLRADIKSVLRKATPADQQQFEVNRADEKRAYQIAKERIRAHDLDMQLVDVEYLFDRSKLLFYFTSEGRVDFRALVRDLAQTFRVRIELRQIGVRDEARMVGGLGVCGRPLCCSTWLNTKQPLSIKMAKTQNISMNPSTTSGCCGRLLCCLRYELSNYEEAIKSLPKKGALINLPEGRAKVESLDLLQIQAKCRLIDDADAEPILLTGEEWAKLNAASEEKREPRGRKARGGTSNKVEKGERGAIPLAEAILKTAEPAESGEPTGNGEPDPSDETESPPRSGERAHACSCSSHSSEGGKGCGCSHNGGGCGCPAREIDSQITEPTPRGAALEESFEACEEQ